MRIIVETSSGLAKYALADEINLFSTATEITVSETVDGEDVVKFIIADLNSTTVTVTDSVTNLPEEWVGNKYTFDGTAWALNPNWVDLEAE